MKGYMTSTYVWAQLKLGREMPGPEIVLGTPGILPAGDQIWDALEKDLGWPSCLASHWSTGVQWPWWPPWWLDSRDDTLGRDSSIKGKGLLLPEVLSCWICSCELQSMLLRRYWTWRAVSFATCLLVAAPTETVVWAHPNFQSSRTSDQSTQQGAAQLVGRSTCQQLVQLYIYRSSRTSDRSTLQGAARLVARSTHWLLTQLYILPYPCVGTDSWLL